MKNKTMLIIPALIGAITASLLTLSAVEGSARENINSAKVIPAPPSIMAVCVASTAQTDLDVNNVRTRILNGGDMWWDLAAGQYEIPKDGGIHSIFAGALWIGGIDLGNNLKVAAQTYRQAGEDFWPGPVDITNASTNDLVCAQYDKHYKITRKEVEDFEAGVVAPATPVILNWPGNGNTSIGQAQYLAPFYDGNMDGIYDPTATYVDSLGVTRPYDYPGFDLKGAGCTYTGCIPDDGLYGDQALWWVFNDVGNIHGSGGPNIGLEIRAQAFAFQTSDEVNNMTFYNYRIYNRSTFQLNSCYFGVWCDADLGNYTDDYVGCDVERGFGYTYNGDNDDDVAASGYGLNPPAVGIDFFRGPVADASDGRDNNRDCVVDENCEQILMSKFVYYNNDATPQGNPSGDVDFYNYLQGKWRDATPMTYGGPGFGGTQNCDFMFPGNPSTDKHDFGIGGNCSTTPTLAGWDEVTAGNTPEDRRMLESAGPFTLMPGALNVITTGVVWARATSGGAIASVNLLKYADTKAQALFDNCFQVTNGPDAPDITIQELDKKLILYLSNSPTSNNYKEDYKEKDPYTSAATYWTLQGYKLYQLKNALVSSSELNDVNKARPVGIYDFKDGVTQIINYYIGGEPNPGYWTPKEMIVSPDEGVVHSIAITKDLFATGDPTLINHKTYYFMVVAYAYNAAEVSTDPTQPSGYNLPYLEGRRNIKPYSAIPHIPNSGSGGTELHSDYGDTLYPANVTRIEGTGNGGNALDLTSSSVSSILSSSDNLAETITYEDGKSPLPFFKVVDPLNIPDLDGINFTLWFEKDTFSAPTVDIANAKWKIKNGSTGNIISSDQAIKMGYEQLFPEWGLSITFNQVAQPGSAAATNNGFIGASMSSNSWLTAFADGDAADYTNWIRSGSEAVVSDGFTGDYNDISLSPVDKDEYYEGVLGGTWAPYRLCAFNPVPTAAAPLTFAKYYGGPATTQQAATANQAGNMYDLASVKVVFTSDKNYWTRCAVLETCDDSAFTEHRNIAGTQTPPNRGARKLDKRRAQSVDKNGKKKGDAGYNASEGDLIDTLGMGWFPGYAVNLETGERLNICFGENSALTSSVGAIYHDTATLVGAFQPNETITGGTSGAMGVIVTDDGVGLMRIKNIGSTSFILGETITGGTSLAASVVTKFTRFEQNGRDMKWNPTSTVYGENPWDASGTGPILGGMHYIYVFGHNRDTSSGGKHNLNMPRYDAGFMINSMLSLSGGLPLDNNITSPSSIKRKVFRDAMWVNIPLLAPGQSLLSSDVSVIINVGKPYRQGYSPAYSAGIPNATDTVYVDTAIAQTNNNYPKYTFNLSTSGIATHTGDQDAAVEALDLIKVVPNPYYAYSAYEANAFDNRVKITNLPEKCTILIYNLSGTLIRKYEKGEEITNHAPHGYDGEIEEPTHDGALDWDLKNMVGIPISSGVYIVHVEVPGVGEKIVKWFGIMRPIDLDSF